MTYSADARSSGLRAKSRSCAFAIANAVGLSVALASTAALAETRLKLAHVFEVSEAFHTCAVAADAPLMEATEGRYGIDVFPASSLGKEVDINEGLGIGTVDVILTGQLFVGRVYGPAAIGGAPYMFRDYDHWDKYRKSDLFQELAQGYAEASGNHIVAVTYYGARHVTSNKPILKPEDMKGLKIRVPNAPLYLMFPRAVDANPTPIAFAEVYLALQQGTVDAQENPLPTIKAKKFYEVQSDINLTAHITEALFTIIGGPIWDQMDEADRNALTAVLQDAETCATAQILEQEAEMVDWFRSQGVHVNEVDRGPFIEAVKKLHNSDLASWDQETYDRLQAIR